MAEVIHRKGPWRSPEAIMDSTRLVVGLMFLSIIMGCGATPKATSAPPGFKVPTNAPARPAAQPTDTALRRPLLAKNADFDSSLPPNTHPRLWITPGDVQAYREWATADNALWAEGLALLAERAIADMDAGLVPDADCGNVGYEEYSTEMYAELFAFLSLVDPDETRRADYAQRARTLLMYIMDLAAQGPASEENYLCNGSTQYPPFRHPEFFTADRDRARYHGEAFALTVDWIYPTLSAQDKATIRQVFLRWSEEIITLGYHHPEPVGVFNDPQLLQDPQQVRFAGNNYYAAHMRNLGLMALVFDEADDPKGELRAYLQNAIGAYLYIFNYLIAKEGRGGVLSEGFEYSPQTASYVTQFLWALKTSQTAGANEAFDATFWDDFIQAYLHAISPAPVQLDRYGEWISEYQPAWYGDSQEYRLPNFINSFGALAHLFESEAQRNAVAWSALYTAPGGAAALLDTLSNPGDYRESILYYLLLANNPNPTDPRPQLATEYYAPGLKRIFSRTNWEANATWFNYRLSWNSIDHQMADGNHFELYRNGEWITKGRNGYANIAEGIASSEFYNTITIGNDRPDRDDSDWRVDLWRRGSQWNLVNDGDPTLLAYIATPQFVFVSGDATPLYNSSYEGATAVQHVSRSLFWVKPDFIVTYDRAKSVAMGYPKRWWLQLANPASVNGAQAVSLTPNGQQLFVSLLLPQNATLQAVNSTEDFVEETVARNEIMNFRLMTEVPGAPVAARLLHVLQAADGGVSPSAVQLVESTDGLWQGAAFEQVVVLFAVDVNQVLTGPLEYTAPAGTHTHWVSGLIPGSGYDSKVTATPGGVTIRIRAGSQYTADAGGVLVLTTP